MAPQQFRHLVGIALPVDQSAPGDIQDQFTLIVIKVLEDPPHIIQIEMVGILERQLHVERIIFCVEKIIGQVSVLPSPLVPFPGIKRKQRICVDHFRGIPAVFIIPQHDPYRR